MSQHSQQKDGRSDHKQSAVQDSPTIGRTQLYSPGSSQASSSPLSDSGYRQRGSRSQRKAAPSPLQMTTSATSPSPTPMRTAFARRPTELGSGTAQTVRYTTQMTDQPRSPKERLDDLLASERSFFNSDDNPPEGLENGIDSRIGKSSMPPTSTTFRSVSDPVPTTRSSKPESDTRPPVIPNTTSHRVDMARGPPRTSSIDSAISNISTGHSHKGSQDGQSQGASPADIANLIQTAGSAEAVIQHLLREKQSQAAQNTQLWRLVDKQRSMILGLNKDLERALKDKERYRKKLKESLANTAPNATDPPSSPKIDEAGSIKNNNLQTMVSAGLREPQGSMDEPASPIDVALAPYPVTPPPDQITATAKPLTNMVEAEHKMPSPSEHAFQQYNPDASAKAIESEKSANAPYNPSLPPSRAHPTEPPRDGAKATITIPLPTVAVTEPSPMDQLRTFPAPPQPPRKPPPAPLNLGKSVNTSSHLHQADSADEADSDYDDVLEVESIPTFTERGRRRTREQDDREREAAALKDAELRSLSKKSKSRPSIPKEKPQDPPSEPAPAPRQAVQISPPDAHLRHLSPPDSVAGSLAGVLSASGFTDKASEGSAHHVVSPPPMSPGLPVSPRPTDRGISSPLPRNPREGNMASPPMSPRGMGGFPSPAPISPRAPRQPIPLPPNTPMSIASPSLPKHGVLELTSPRPLQITKKPANNSSKESEAAPPVSEGSAIYRGFVTEDYPALLLPPNALPSIDVRVASSTLKPSRASLLFPDKLDEDPVFTLAIFSRSDGRELWRVEKDSASLYSLDSQLKRSAYFAAQPPDNALFSGHAPAKVDARRIALNKYLNEILNTELDTQSGLEICRYLSTNAMDPNPEESAGSSDSAADVPMKLGPGGRPTKNGYLTKRGKNFGGWKARFFVLYGPVFKYYEAPGGAHLGTIKLQNAQIGKQQQQVDNQSPSRDADEINNEYRHAFLILEPKRKDSTSLVRHVLCAENDQERDAWVDALLQYVDYRDSEDEDDEPYTRSDSTGAKRAAGSNSKKKVYGQGRVLDIPELENSLRGFSYESAAQGELPHGARSRTTGTPSPPAVGNEKDPIAQLPQSQSSISISEPKNGAVIQDSSAWGNKMSSLAPAEDKIKQKKRSFFGFGSKPRASSDSPDHASEPQTNLNQPSSEQHAPIRAAFGAPLAEAVRYNHPFDVDVNLPAVVYRCVEYLDAKNAASEEGIFRLSGSNVVIKSLRERFNIEGDVNLLKDDQYYDIHAVASLLKLYLRELPTTILTRELHLDFLAVTELHDLQQKIHALNGLVYRLPPPNKTLLRYIAGFLINIINHSDVNKMTVRNVGIVFSPTLNIPAPVFALFLQQFDGIFGNEPEEDHQNPIEVTVTAPPLTPEDIRSPRKQQFQELPTPSYNQQSFARPPAAFPMLGQPVQEVYDTGFTPLQPTYETQLYSGAGSETLGGPEYGVHTQTLAGPAYEQFSNAGSMGYHQYLSSQSPGSQAGSGNTKANRRESAMFGMGMDLGQKRPSYQNLRDESRLVNEESFFE